MFNNLQCLPPAPHLLEILGLSELTVIAHLPQKHSHTRIAEYKKKNNNSVHEKQVYDNISPSAETLWHRATLAQGQTTVS